VPLKNTGTSVASLIVFDLIRSNPTHPSSVIGQLLSATHTYAGKGHRAFENKDSQPIQAREKMNI
jgi:hypothetical protein